MELECGYSPQDKTIAILSFLAPPFIGLGQGCCWKINPGKSTAVRRSCFLPHSTDIVYKLLHTHTHTHIYKDMHSPPLPRSLASVALNRQPDKRVCDLRRNSGCGSGWLLAGAGFLPLLQSRVFMVYVLLCWGVFPVLTLYSPRSIVWGLFFSPHLPHVMLYFFFPCLLAFHYWLYPVWLCMWRIIKNLEPWTLKML